MSKKRVAVYIDGFNYYYAIVDYLHKGSFLCNLKWLDYRQLIEKKILKNNNDADKTNLKINFYTAINTYRPKASQLKHERYIKALEKSGINVIRGKYKLREVFLSCHLNCSTCNKIIFLRDYNITKNEPVICDQCQTNIDLSQYTRAQHPEEKQTDINIAKDILVDAITDKVDLIYIFSTDSDFVPIVDYILNTLNPQIEVDNINNPNNPKTKKEIIIVAPYTKEVRVDTIEENGKFIKKEYSEPRYKIENFIALGAKELRLKMGQLSHYQFPSPYCGLTKPEGW